ncbi:17.4 kDa class I heat shock protein-like [Phragmites australis]|uniref:17.4 kDa class I heat shock protein-like n=1 Tax=Phragmites australis TaxID=29695 RepID=UPI002D782B74|nr:17.4 kDa class I heat shock protein-like [Phragmites australis]
MACSKPQRSSANCGAAPACDADIDPKVEWLVEAASYTLRLNLPGFKKEDFKVQVYSDGRLTVRVQRPAGCVRFHKVFQLPPTANLDGVAGRFDGTVLSLTVPKVQASGTEMVLCVAGPKWAEVVGAKGHMVTAAVAGFALGVFVAHRLLSATNS